MCESLQLYFSTDILIFFKDKTESSALELKRMEIDWDFQIVAGLRDLPARLVTSFLEIAARQKFRNSIWFSNNKTLKKAEKIDLQNLNI